MNDDKIFIRKKRRIGGMVEVRSGGKVHISVSISQRVDGKNKTFAAPREAVDAKNRFGDGPFVFVGKDGSNGKTEAIVQVPDGRIIRVPLLFLYARL